MNRTGLFIALGLAFVVGLLFGLYPELDLKLAALFYDTATRSFPLKLNAMAALARDGAMWIAWGLALPTIAALVVKLVRPDRPLLISGRAIIFLLVTLTLAAGILTNLTFKSYWGRPRQLDNQRDNRRQRQPPRDPHRAVARERSQRIDLERKGFCRGIIEQRSQLQIELGINPEQQCDDKRQAQRDEKSGPVHGAGFSRGGSLRKG